MTSLEAVLTQRLAASFAAVAGEPADPAVRRSQHADFQADGALPLARSLKRAPRDIAAAVLEHDPLDDLCATAEIAGPGFINLTARDDVLSRLAGDLTGDERLGAPPAEKAEIVVVDYSAPNAAKEMHVGHLRSTIIGDATVRLLEWRGHTVLRKNHLGDWGTPFGMLIEHLVDLGGVETVEDLSVGDLNSFYQAARRKFDGDEEFKTRSRRRVVALQGGDEETLRLWKLLIDQSEEYFMSVYRRLNVRLTTEDFAGESFYNDQLESVATELEELGLLRESDGALCVFPEGFTNRDGAPLPLIVKKGDGGFGYDTTDLAAIRHRIRDLNATRLLYVVGLPQRQHFLMVFQAAREAGWATPAIHAEHIGFGSILGPDGKMFRTRAGATIKFTELLDEAVTRAAAQVSEKNPDLDPEIATSVATAVGIGAVKYADLSTDKTKDYTFDYDRMLSFDGNTAPYLQYAHARIHSIFRRAEQKLQDATGPIVIEDPAERRLALALLEFGDLVVDLDETLDFHRLCAYLYGLATAFTSFYERCPVLRAEAPVRASRLALCALTARTLAQGLELLGITAPDQM